MSKQNGSSKSIVTLAGEFKEISELRKYCNSQHETITKLVDKLKIIEEENNQLKSMLISVTPNIMVSSEIKLDKPPSSPEEEICIIQIARIKRLAEQRDLTLEEVKKLDLLVKNLKLLRNIDKNSSEEKEVDPIHTIASADLLQIAALEEEPKNVAIDE